MRNILLIEDNPSDRLLLQFLLRRSELNCQTTSASTLAEALAKLACDTYSSAILDLTLPDAAGLAPLKRIRQTHPELPVIVLTGLAEKPMAAKALNAGAQDYLVKGAGLTPELLEQTIRHAIRRQALVNSLHRERERAQRAEDNFHTIAANADGLVVFDEHGVVRFANSAAGTLLDSSPEELVDAPLPIAMMKGERREVVIGLPPDERIIELRTTATRWDGKAAVMAELRDISDRHELYAARREIRRFEISTQLVAMIAHDFGNLLTGIRGRVELTQMILRADHPAHKHLTAIEAASTRACDLVERLRTHGASRRAAPARIRPGPVLRAHIPSLSHAVGAGIALSFPVPESLPEIVIDPDQLTWVLQQLIENARDAQEGRGRIDVRLDTPSGDAGLRGAGRGSLRVRVTDSGPGLPADLGERIFAPFVTTRASDENTGLGLTLVRALVERAGGSVSVISSPGAGATFTVLLPIAAPVPGHRSALHAPPQTAAPDLATAATVLVVDDRPVERTLVRTILEKAGYDVVLAGDGQEAQERFAETRPDLLLTDVHMPGLSGPALARKLRQTLPDLSVILMSGLEVHTDLPNAGILRKPFDVDELLAAVRSATRED